MSKHLCPICGREMKMDHRIVYADYFCKRHSHFYSMRIMHGEIIKEKIRVIDGEDNTRLYVKVNYDEGNMQVWKEGIERITVNEIFKPDCSNLKALRNKVKTFLMFG